MRIVHIVQSLQLGGQERLVLDLCRRLSRLGHDPAVVTLTPGGALREEFGPIPVHEVERTSGFDRMTPLRMVRLLSVLRPDVVHTHNPAAMLYGVPAARLSGVPCVVHTKHGRNRYGPRSLPVVRMIAQSVSAFVCVSPETAQVAREKERAPERLLYVVPNGIPLDRFGPDDAARARVRKELGLPEGAFVVGSVGRLSREKDYPLLVRAMAPLLGPSCRLVIVGEGPDRPRIEAAIAQVDEGVRGCITLTGLRRDVPACLAALDAFALTSYTEGLPLVIPEAMACALPVVATAVGGVPGIVPEGVGTLKAHGDEAGLREALRALRDDRALTQKRGSAARAFAISRFSLDVMTARYQALYQLHEGRGTVARRIIEGLGSLMAPG